MSPSRKSAWSSTRRSRTGGMLSLPPRSWHGDGGRHLCARTRLASHLARAAEGLDPLPHTRQAQGPRLAVPLAARGEALAIVGNDDLQVSGPVGRERHRGLMGPGVLAHVGQGFLDEPEELERCERGELVGHVIRAKARAKLMSLFKLVQVVLEGADQPAFR